MKSKEPIWKKKQVYYVPILALRQSGRLPFDFPLFSNRLFKQSRNCDASAKQSQHAPHCLLWLKSQHRGRDGYGGQLHPWRTGGKCWVFTVPHCLLYANTTVSIMNGHDMGHGITMELDKNLQVVTIILRVLCFIIGSYLGHGTSLTHTLLKSVIIHSFGDQWPVQS